jgi:hypothetical protein
MDERLNGTWETSDDDEELQRSFWSFWNMGKGSEPLLLCRIGADFLRQNRELLQ